MEKIIFTDLDGTLTLKGTYKQFLMRNAKLSLVGKHFFKLSRMLFLYGIGQLHHDDVQTITFKIFFDGYDMQKPLGDFLENIVWNEKVLQLVNEKKEQGYKVVVVSASPDIYIKDVCEYLGFDDYICTRAKNNGSELDGTFDGGMCNFEEKTKRIKNYLGDLKPEHTISYGNSSGDHDMLRFCDEAYFVTGKKVEKFESI